MTETTPPLPAIPTIRPDDIAPPSVCRWAVLLEYDGQGLVGWQRQSSEELVSVQGLLEGAARNLTGGRTVRSITAGRTDAGVHAAGQVAHLDFPADVTLSSATVRDGLNFYMKPHPVVVLMARPVLPNWNARFSACARAYRYRILNRSARPALDEGRVWHIKAPLDVDIMQRAGRCLLGRHDFTSFRASACQARSPVRSLERLDVRREGEYVVVETAARSFLHHQVRNMVGTLKMVGEGRWEPERVAEALAARDRRAAGPTAPPDGLCLTAVGYEDNPFSR
ncbi:tRNA pseudouridine(38-40) synthase TruA [Komagataeibacter nataicola]|uniref:tRNA pseudouridine synthase A n=1 Tax=Komagataeibacter nataicola TaxID=265960 RepID=A0A9N7CZ04_9PROT|nr:tRNA pseudouridine(38-40) synthase TruA [Komagataeibacter nataicola]AQU88246.1 tRNA pseudouridine(38-40) synthase TruA [Komagataeibacter nataicola]PYD67697.1 tRNA pseudouridine(38-40) synthase TruA [Komagataeibacter nataicola]WEQ54653.1 tRNA pseudouridine(38-40) synthase TruA [Komagataeibacter nataicola]WNM09017.1 tRNA pseudouridine(38-40) synthase TruA [Komagataeibacter nataicola]GBR13982.1 tRNA pseudouridine synthase A [Komagataeibacter nataicola NRIC 0616]